MSGKKSNATNTPPNIQTNTTRVSISSASCRLSQWTSDRSATGDMDLESNDTMKGIGTLSLSISHLKEPERW